MEISSSRSTCPAAAALWGVISTGSLMGLGSQEAPVGVHIAGFSPVEGSKITTP